MSLPPSNRPFSGQDGAMPSDSYEKHPPDSLQELSSGASSLERLGERLGESIHALDSLCDASTQISLEAQGLYPSIQESNVEASVGQHRVPSPQPTNPHSPIRVLPYGSERVGSGELINTPRPWIRLWARISDTVLYEYVAFFLVLPLYIAAPFLKFPVYFADAALFSLMFLGAWIPVEGVILHYFGFTPGKKWMNIHVRSPGQGGTYQRYPSLGSSIRRAFFVWLHGFGLFIPFLTVITQWISYQELDRHHKTVWDLKENLEVFHGPIPLWGWVYSTLLVGSFVVLQLLIQLSHLSQVVQQIHPYTQ